MYEKYLSGGITKFSYFLARVKKYQNNRYFFYNLYAGITTYLQYLLKYNKIVNNKHFTFLGSIINISKEYETLYNGCFGKLS